MRRRVPLIAAVLALLLLLPASLALADDPLVPPRPDGAPSLGAKPPLYERYEPWAYTFDGEDWNRADYATIYFWINELQVAKAWAMMMAIRTVEYALYPDLIDKEFIDQTRPVMRTLDSELWSFYGPRLAMGALALTALWALWLRVQGQSSRAWGVLGTSLLIFMLTAIVLQNGQKSLLSGITLSRGLAVELFKTVDQVTQGTPRVSLLFRGGDAAWRTYVYEPWLAGELSEQGQIAYRSSDGLDGGKFLAKTPTERQNVCLYNLTQGEEYCPWWDLDYLPRRMLLSGWTTLSGLTVAGVIFVLAGSILLSQFALLLFVMLAPVWLMAALWWPEGGMRLVRGILIRTVGAFVAQGMLAATLAVFLVMTAMTEATFAKGGWMLNSVLVLGLAILAFRYRYAWLEPLALARIHIARRQETAERRTLRTGREAVRSAQAGATLVHEAVPVFASVPEAEVTDRTAPRIEWQRATIPVSEREVRPGSERVGHSPGEVFHTQLERLREELVLRQETVLYERNLEGEGAEPTPVAPPPRESRTRPGGKRSDISRMRPPRPPL